MSRVFVQVICYVLTLPVLAQSQSARWNYLVESKQVSTPYFLVKHSDVAEVEGKLIRRLDEEYSIIHLDHGSTKELYPMSPVNNEWKLNIRNPNRANQIFYIKTLKHKKLDMGDDLEIVREFGDDLYVVKGKYRRIKEKLLGNPSIIYISDEMSAPQTEARVIDMNINPNRVNKIHHFYPNLDGSNQTVSIQENQYDVTDLDIKGRDVPSSLGAETVDNHSTEMATIIAGNGNSFVTGRGVAGGANITSSDFFVTLPDDDSDYQTLNIQTQNHSYGTSIESFYGAQANAFDQSAFNNRALLHVFSSGNQGEEASSDGTYAGLGGFANLTGNFKMAKNVLVVGSVDTVGNVVPFSSRGPAYDGRVKPELVAYSTAGSSNSAALVSGVSALLQQEFEETNGAEIPSALLKALLINGALDVGSPGLDHLTGYGSVDAFGSLESLRATQYYTGSVSVGGLNQHVLVVPSNAANLKITLCWTDIPAPAGNFQALTNDLDLKLIDGSSGETLPWVLSTASSVSSLSAAATRGIDRLNNIEQITLDEVTDTDYVIEVTGFGVTGSQEYFIAYQYDLEETFKWDYPTASDNMPYNGESGSYVRWKSTLSADEGTLEYSIDNGANWQFLADIDLSVGQWRWSDVPDLNLAALVRMQAGGESFLSDEFTISQPNRISVGFNCADSTLLQWNDLGAEQYDIYTVGEQELELFSSVQDTFLIIPDTSVLIDNHFSIRPVLSTGKELIASETVDYTQQGGTCFLLSFFQEVALDTGIYLNLSLGTTYGIAEILFERKDNNSFEVVRTLSGAADGEIRILDDNPNQGFNEHKVTIDFINGQQVEEIATNTYYLTDIPLILFPNPLVNASEMNLLTKDFGAETVIFRIFDSKGIEVVTRELLSTLETIPFVNLSVGIYYYRLERQGGSVQVGKLIVR